MYCPNCGYQNAQESKFCTNCGKALPATERSAPLPSSAPSQTQEQPGRGGLILALGILSVVALGFIVGIPAWVMGNHDLKRIRLGRIVADQKGLTTAGMVIGIIGTFLSGAAVIVVILAVTTTLVTFNALKRPASENLAAVSPVHQPKEAALAYYDNIDQVKGQTDDETPAVFLLRVSLGYDPADKQIDVEIGLREREIQNLLLKYVSGRTAAELSPAHYKDLGEGMREAINAIMTTGKIKSVVFREFTVVK